MRLFVPLAIAFLLFQSAPPSPTPAKVSPKKPNSTNTRTEQANPAPHDSSAPPANVQIITEASENPSKQESNKSSTDWWLTVFTGALVLVAVLQFFAMHRQAEYMRKGLRISIGAARATKQAVLAAKSSAEAALLNAQASISAERPWIIIVVKENNMGDFTFFARNYGRTPAEIVSFSSEITFVEDDVQNLPLPPQYSFAYLSDVTILVPAREEAGEENDFGLLWYSADAYLREMSKEKVEAIKRGKLRYVFYFKVVYRNTLSSAGIHMPNYETCKGFWYSPVVARIRTDRVPHEYNKST
jgi:hypothetical protein